MNSHTRNLGGIIEIDLEEIRFREYGKSRQYFVSIGGEVVPVGGFVNLYHVRRFAARLAEKGICSDLGGDRCARESILVEWAERLPLAMREAVPDSKGRADGKDS